MRIGFGYDVHRFGEGRSLILGGVEIPFEKGLIGHSDADVLLHAITDAVLGAVALGDIGAFFPDTDPQWRDADSRDLLRESYRMVRQEGFRVHNVDCTVVLERPKLRPHIEEMRTVIAECVDVEREYVSVKATTNESLDAIGRGDGAAAYAICMVVDIGRGAGDE